MRMSRGMDPRYILCRGNRLEGSDVVMGRVGGRPVNAKGNYPIIYIYRSVGQKPTIYDSHVIFQRK